LLYISMINAVILYLFVCGVYKKNKLRNKLLGSYNSNSKSLKFIQASGRGYNILCNNYYIVILNHGDSTIHILWTILFVQVLFSSC